MTGFGRCEVQEADRKITVEMKSVNHRYLDFSIKLPRRLNLFESRIRNIIKEYAEISHQEKKPVTLYNYASSLLHLNGSKYFLTEFAGDIFAPCYRR